MENGPVIEYKSAPKTEHLKASVLPKVTIERKCRRYLSGIKDRK